MWQGQTVEDWQEQFTPDIKIIKTPGHSHDALSLLVKTDQGIVAIVGDVFWKENSPEQDPYAINPEQLEQSRQQVLSFADYIIPGHGPMYKVKK